MVYTIKIKHLLQRTTCYAFPQCYCWCIQLFSMKVSQRYALPFHNLRSCPLKRIPSSGRHTRVHLTYEPGYVITCQIWPLPQATRFVCRIGNRPPIYPHLHIVSRPRSSTGRHHLKYVAAYEMIGVAPQLEAIRSTSRRTH